jgi:hypothetical protein
MTNSALLANMRLSNDWFDRKKEHGEVYPFCTYLIPARSGQAGACVRAAAPPI